ncbi:hypothetical protein B0H14DRAFT_2576729 [Mycena olivaceomarginata]|nr:hypothetical protein B0H14DRAFT_2576729 [Mycena olivaceomarginata]
MALSRYKDWRNLQRMVLDEPKGEHKKHTLRKPASSQHQRPSDKLGSGGTVVGAGFMESEKHPERKKKDIQFGAKSRTPEVEHSQGRDKTPEATDMKDLIPEAKTQSKDNSDFSWPAQKVDERGRSRKEAEGDMEEEEKEKQRDTTLRGNKWPSPKSRDMDSKSCAYANNADKNVMLMRQLK